MFRGYPDQELIEDLTHGPHLALPRRPRDRAAEAEPGVLPDFRRRPRGAVARPGPQPASRLRLVLPVLPRPRADAGARRHADRDPLRGGRLGARPGVGRTADAVPLGPQGAQHRQPDAARPARQCIPAVGSAEAARYIGRRRPRRAAWRTATSSPTSASAKGATSEGEFWESLNTACTEHLPVLYVVADNGFAISVPASEQAPAPVERNGAGVPGLGRSTASTAATTSRRAGSGAEAIAHVRAGVGPGADPRDRDPSVFALGRRHADEVPLDGRAGRRDRARPDHVARERRSSTAACSAPDEATGVARRGVPDRGRRGQGGAGGAAPRSRARSRCT